MPQAKSHKQQLPKVCLRVTHIMSGYTHHASAKSLLHQNDKKELKK